MKTRTLYAIRSYSGDLCMMAGWGKSIQEAVVDFKQRVLIETVEKERKRVTWKDNMSVILSTSIKKLKTEMDYYLDEFSVHYTFYPEVYCEERGEWLQDTKKQSGTFTLKFPIKRTF